MKTLVKDIRNFVEKHMIFSGAVLLVFIPSMAQIVNSDILWSIIDKIVF